MTTLTPWVDKLFQADSADTLRSAHLVRNPAFNPAELPRIAILGAAEEGIRLVEICQGRGIEIVALCDANPAKHGMAVGAYVVQPVERLEDVDRSTPVVVASHRVLKVVDYVQRMGFRHVAPLALLQLLSPEIFRPHMFYDGWLEDLFENRDKYRTLFELLADDFSRQVLDAVLGYRMSADATVLRPVVEWELYNPAGLLHFGDHEVYIDGGTFDGDTIRLFIKRVNGKFDRIIGFEPDPETFKRLKENFAHEPRMEPINKGLFSHTTVLRFNNSGTRGSIFTGEEGIKVPVTSLDEMLEEAPVTYIKLNIEGAEPEALNGAAKAIKRCTPLLAISAYHKPGHLWQLPFQIQELNERYKLYLRQHDGGVIETVIYALPDTDNYRNSQPKQKTDVFVKKRTLSDDSPPPPTIVCP